MLSPRIFAWADQVYAFCGVGLIEWRGRRCRKATTLLRIVQIAVYFYVLSGNIALRRSQGAGSVWMNPMILLHTGRLMGVISTVVALISSVLEPEDSGLEVRKIPRDVRTQVVSVLVFLANATLFLRMVTAEPIEIRNLTPIGHCLLFLCPTTLESLALFIFLSRVETINRRFRALNEGCPRDRLDIDAIVKLKLQHREVAETIRRLMDVHSTMILTICTRLFFVLMAHCTAVYLDVLVGSALRQIKLANFLSTCVEFLLLGLVCRRCTLASIEGNRIPELAEQVLQEDDPLDARLKDAMLNFYFRVQSVDFNVFNMFNVNSHFFLGFLGGIFTQYVVVLRF